MKKTYVIFSAVLVVLILAFSFTKTYLHSLEDEAKWKQRSATIRAELDSLEAAMESRFGETKAFESVGSQEPDSSIDEPEVEAQVTRPGPSEAKPVEQVKKEPVKKNDLASGAEDTSAKPTADELTIYKLYVQRRMALPSVITAYKLRKAKEQILDDLGMSYGVTAEQVLKIVDKVYEYRRKGSND